MLKASTHPTPANADRLTAANDLAPLEAASSAVGSGVSAGTTADITTMSTLSMSPETVA